MPADSTPASPTAQRVPDTAPSDRALLALHTLQADLARPAPRGDALASLLCGLLTHSGAREAALAWWEGEHARLALHAQRPAEPGPPFLTSPHVDDAHIWLAAMQEALSQGQCISYPPDAAAPDQVEQARRACAASEVRRVVTLILPGQPQPPLGAITLVWGEGPDTPTAAAALAWQALATGIAPQLARLRPAQRSWPARLRGCTGACWAAWRRVRPPRTP